MKSCSAIAICLVAATAIQNVYAKTLTIVKSSSGKVYIDSPNGMIEYDALKIVDLTDDTTPVDPNPNDEWGLIKTSKDAADDVTDYPRKNEDRIKLARAWRAISGQGYSSKKIDGTESDEHPNGRSQLSIALDTAFALITGARADEWRPWKVATTDRMNANVPTINTPEKEARALSHIAAGLESGISDELQKATDWDRFADWVVNVLIPLIETLIKLFSAGDIAGANAVLEYAIGGAL